MKHLVAAQKTRRAGAVGSKAVLASGLLAIVLSVLAIGVLNQRLKSNLTQKIEQIEAQKQGVEGRSSKESFALTVAKVKQEEALTELRRTTNLLEKLSADVTQFLKRGGALSTNGSGPEAAARKFFEQAVDSTPAPTELNAKLEGIQRAIFGIESVRGTPILPDPHVISNQKQITEWAATASEKLNDLQSRLDQILRGAKTDASDTSLSNQVTNTGTGGTDKVEASEASAVVAESKADADLILAEAKEEADGILAEIRAEAARILDEARNEAMRILAEARTEAERILAQTKDQRLAREPSKDQMANEPQAHAANEPVTSVPIPQAAPGQSLESVLDARTRSWLLPFTTPGNMRLPESFRAEKVPISLSQLKSFGALDPDPKGLQRLVEIAATPRDAVRPRWKFKKTKHGWQLNANEIEQVGAIQKVLKEFGPALVASGLLAE